MHVSVWLCFSCNLWLHLVFSIWHPVIVWRLRYAIAFLFAWVVLVFKSGTNRPAFMCQIVTWTSGCLHLCTKCMSLPSWNSLSKCQMCDSILYCMHHAPYGWLCNDAYVCCILWLSHARIRTIIIANIFIPVMHAKCSFKVHSDFVSHRFSLNHLDLDYYYCTLNRTEVSRMARFIRTSILFQ